MPVPAPTRRAVLALPALLPALVLARPARAAAEPLRIGLLHTLSPAPL